VGTASRARVVNAVRTSSAVRALRRSSVGDRLAGSRLWRSVRARSRDVNPLEEFFRSHEGRLIHKYTHYFDIYHRHLQPYRGKPVTIVEFGVSQGGSLQMWRDYFGPEARLVGVDINPKCVDAAGDQIEVVIGDQEDREFLRSLAQRLGTVDVLIEDGGHTGPQQIATFEEFWPHIADGGVLLVEDLHTSYWPRYGGGLRREGTFIEYAKRLIDQQHAWYARKDPSFRVDRYTRTIRGMHCYDSIIVFDKGRVIRPTPVKSGHTRNE
jgi:cephalosporin hydroxylase